MRMFIPVRMQWVGLCGYAALVFAWKGEWIVETKAATEKLMLCLIEDSLKDCIGGHVLGKTWRKTGNVLPGSSSLIGQ